MSTNQINSFSCFSLPHPRPFTIVTTQNHRLFQGAGELIKLGDLDITEAIQLVEESLELQKEEISEEVRELCQIQGKIPLTLHQSISYIKQTCAEDSSTDYAKAIKEFIKLHEEDRKSAANVKLNEYEHTYKETLLSNWNLSIKRVQGNEEVGKIAMKIIQILIYWAEGNGVGTEADFLIKEAVNKIEYLESKHESKKFTEMEIGKAIHLLTSYFILRKVPKKHG